MYAGRTPWSGSDRLGRRSQRPGRAGPVLTRSEGGTDTAAMELTLQPDVVTNVDDAGGRWHHERGRVSHHGTQVGFYASTTQQGSVGTEAHGGATLTLTIFFLGSTPPETITVHGRHDADSDSATGSVSAASAGHAGRVGRRFTRAGDTVTID